jgi:hypothetical protein
MESRKRLEAELVAKADALFTEFLNKEVTPNDRLKHARLMAHQRKIFIAGYVAGFHEREARRERALVPPADSPSVE